MSQYYNILSFKEANQWGNDYGQFQAFDCEFEGIEGDVSISKKIKPNGTYDNPGTGQVYGDIVQQGNGLKFKSQQRPQGQQPPQQQQMQPQQHHDMSARIPDWFMAYGNMIEYIYKEMHKQPDLLDQPIAGGSFDVPETTQDKATGEGGAAVNKALGLDDETVS